MSIKLTNNIPGVKKALEEAINAAGQEIKISAVAEVKSNTPVNTGTLKRSFEGRNERLKVAHIKVYIGSNIKYAPIVNAKGRSRKFFTNTLERYSNTAKAILMKHLKGVK